MEERIEKDGKLYAIVVRRHFWSEGVKFFTEPEHEMQFGVIVREGGSVIDAHYHKPIKRELVGTAEVIHIEFGEVNATIYDDAKSEIGNILLGSGDIIILLAGGHRFWFTKTSKMMECKIGPYYGKEEDKSYIEERKDVVI